MIKHFLTVLCFCALFFIPATFAEKASVKADQRVQKEAIYVGGTQFWRQIRDGEVGFTANQNKENGILINVKGMYWEEIRNKWISPFGAFVLLGALAGISFFYLFFGRIKLKVARSGNKIPRWSAIDRSLHWFTALNFLILGFSGLLLFYGRYMIKPHVSDSFWASLIYGSKIAHNYIGPLFFITLSIILVKWFKKNLFNKVDLNWLKQGGGLISANKHPDAEFCNAGEKIWFWLLATVGVLVCISGFILDFPNFEQTRLTMQIANVIHGMSSLTLFAIALGHIYIGTLGTEGAIEGMVTGKVDESWAEQHHNLWLRKIRAKEEINEEEIIQTLKKAGFSKQDKDD